MLADWIVRLAFPSYECEQCVGQEPWRGCYCAYYGASAPNKGPEWWRYKLQQAVRWTIERNTTVTYL
jgi:hypothetical protein